MCMPYGSVATLWFDVGIDRYTTVWLCVITPGQLWFDVGIDRYTTVKSKRPTRAQLWFDVGIDRYTTKSKERLKTICCGLM